MWSDMPVDEVMVVLERLRLDLNSMSLDLLIKAAATARTSQRSLTAVSRTDRTAPDSGANFGYPLDLDLRIRIPAHLQDTLH